VGDRFLLPVSHGEIRRAHLRVDGVIVVRV
jgi:hypothetical protein